MGNSVESQVYVFLVTLYGGVVIGFIYDVYRIFRYFFKPKKVATFVEDLVFWIIVSMIALFILIFSNWGELRGYVFLGFLCGAILYSKLLSKPIITILVHFITFIFKTVRKVLRIILYPFKLLGKVLYNPYSNTKSKVKKGYRKAKRTASIPFRLIKDIKKYIRIIKKKK